MAKRNTRTIWDDANAATGGSAGTGAVIALLAVAYLVVFLGIGQIRDAVDGHGLDGDVARADIGEYVRPADGPLYETDEMYVDRYTVGLKAEGTPGPRFVYDMRPFSFADHRGKWAFVVFGTGGGNQTGVDALGNFSQQYARGLRVMMKETGEASEVWWIRMNPTSVGQPWIWGLGSWDRPLPEGACEWEADESKFNTAFNTHIKRTGKKCVDRIIYAGHEGTDRINEDGWANYRPQMEWLYREVLTGPYEYLRVNPYMPGRTEGLMAYLPMVGVLDPKGRLHLVHRGPGKGIQSSLSVADEVHTALNFYFDLKAQYEGVAQESAPEALSLGEVESKLLGVVIGQRRVANLGEGGK